MVENAAAQLEREVPKSGVNNAPCDDGCLDAVACVALHPNVAARDPGKGQYASKQGAKCRVPNPALAGEREFDLHATLQHLASWPAMPQPAMEATSLFADLPDGRSCEAARVPAEWCLEPAGECFPGVAG